jgi:hypothetical protein
VREVMMCKGEGDDDEVMMVRMRMKVGMGNC